MSGHASHKGFSGELKLADEGCQKEGGIDKTSSPRSNKKLHAYIYEGFLIWCGISIAAYFGAYIRVGISYFKVWKFESNFTVMYA
jgi:hypothetical protein